MAEYITNTEELTSVANAIRTACATSDPLVYPQGFISALSGKTVVDLSSDTVNAESLTYGTTAHDKDGRQITGTMFSVGSLWASDKNIHPASALGFGEWEKIRDSPFTWAEAKKHTWAELKQSTWAWEKFRKNVYVWIRTA